MGNAIESLIRNIFDRRKNKTISSRSQPDHPERLPPDKLTSGKNTEQKSEPQSAAPITTAGTGSVVTKTTGAESVATIPVETTTTVTTVDDRTVTTITTKAESLETTAIVIKMDLEAVTTITTTTPEAVIATTPTEAVSSSKKCSNFYLSCRGNDIEEVKELLKIITLEDIDRLEPNGSTALHAACYHGHQEIVLLLLEAGADRAVHNKYKYLPFDEAANDDIKKLFLRVPNNNRLVSSTGAIEWELIDDDALEQAVQERENIRSLYDNVTRTTPIDKMLEKIEKNYINKGLTNFTGIENIKRFFQKATKEQDPRWIIKAYTAETDFYKVLNTEIACGATKYQSERRYIIALLWHHPILDQLSFIGIAYRVIRVNSNDLKKYQVGSSLMTKSFLSTSIDEKAAAWFLCQQESTTVQSEDRRCVKLDGTLIKSWIMCTYRIKHRRTGLHIEDLSQYTNEGEILIMPYTVFKVNKVKNVKPTYLSDEQLITKIELEECDHDLSTEHNID